MRRRVVPVSTNTIWYYWVPVQEVFVKKEKSLKKRDVGSGHEESVRERILRAAMEAFMEYGYTQTSTLEIATRARVSKRELYALFGNKQAMLAACIADRSRRMRLPAELPAVRDREMLAATLTRFGAILLREICHPAVIGVFRLAIAEAGRSPEVARTLDDLGREASRAAVRSVLAQAHSAGLLRAVDPDPMVGQFLALLWGNLMISLLLRLRDAPTTREIGRRAKSATEAFLQLHPAPEIPRRASLSSKQS
jgi:AcrR family transcriptional regulator